MDNNRNNNKGILILLITTPVEEIISLPKGFFLSCKLMGRELVQQTLKLPG